MNNSAVKVTSIVGVVVLVALIIWMSYSHVDKIRDRKLGKYDMDSELSERLDRIPSEWESSTGDEFRAMLSEIETMSNMVDSFPKKEYVDKVKEAFNGVAPGYFTRSSWDENDIKTLSLLAGYLGADDVKEYADGYFNAKRAIAQSPACYSIDAVRFCVQAYQKYRQAPWSNCIELQNWLEPVYDASCKGFENNVLVPLAGKLSNYSSNYSGKESFSRDYETLSKGVEGIRALGYSPKATSALYATIDYSGALNSLN